MESIFTWKNLIFAILFIMLGIYLGEKMSYGNIPDTIIAKQIEIDTLIVQKDVLKYKYLDSKKNVVKWDTLYVSGKDTICDSLVYAQRIALKNCDTLYVTQEKVIVKMDTLINIQNVYIKEKTGRKPRIGAFLGPNLNPDGQIRLGIGAGIVF